MSKDSNIHAERGAENLNNGQFDLAVDHFSKAIEADPSIAHYHSERAVAFVNMKKFQLAIQDLNQAVELDPNYGFRYAARAFVKNALGDKNGAIADYEKAIELDPEDAISRNNLGLIYEYGGKMEASKTLFKEADELSDATNNPLPEINKEGGNGPKSDAHNQQNTSNKEDKISFLQAIKKIFTDKDTFKEFISFIKNGFKFK